MPILLPDARHLSDEALQALRVRAVRGRELGYSAVALADLFGVAPETITRWWTAYSAAGVPALPGERTGRPPGSGAALTDAQGRRIQELLDTHTPDQFGLAHALWTRRAIGDLIRREFDVDLADRTVGQYLRRWGYTAKAPARQSRHQRPDAVNLWLRTIYPALVERAAAEGAEIFWTDEVGIAADHHPGRGYARRGERAVLVTPAPHIRVNQITAFSNTGQVRFMNYTGSLTAAVFLEFLALLISGAEQKIILIADRLQAHKTPAVLAWVAAHRAQIEVYFLPSYSPEMNPVEYMNNDLKGTVNRAGLPDDQATLRSRVVEFMTKLARLPKHVASYFQHPEVQYAAAQT